MNAIALTNTPSQMLIKPVLNQAADAEENFEKNEQEATTEGKEMDIEEIKKIVFDILKEAGLAIGGKDAVVEAVKREVAEEKLDKLEDEAEMKAAEAIVESATAKDKEVKNEACDKVKDEVKNEVCDEVKKDEVIKAEVLN